MKKFNWNKILNITLIAFIALVASSIIALGAVSKTIASVNAENLVEGVPFKSGVVSRDANGFSNNQFNYTDDGSIYKGQIETIYLNDYVMLKNFNAEKKLSQTGNSASVENVFLSFGADKSLLHINEETGEVEETDKSLQEKNILLLTSLKINATLNGESINVGSVNAYNCKAGTLPGNNTEAYSWHYYLDGKTFGEGLYKFSFSYVYAKNGQVFNEKIYDYSFYLMDQSKYESYPTILNSVSGNPSSTKVVQYFYNYTNNSLPLYSYDASRYNISYVRTKNKEYEKVTTSFSILNNVGTLSITSSLKGTITKNINPNANGEYFVNLEFDTLGTYEFSNKYIVKTSSGFNIVENMLPYDVNNKMTITNSITNLPEIVNGYEEGLLQKGLINLHLFGIKTYYTKGGNGVELKNLTISSDKTSEIYSMDPVNPNYNFGFSNELAKKYGSNYKYPTTNLAPIYFDYYGSFNFQNSTPLSKYQVYDKSFNDSNFSVSNPVQTGYLTKDTILNKAGYYELIFNYKYDLYNVDNLNSETVQKQVFTFRIDNSTPEISLFTGIDQDKLKNNAFTNSFVNASWLSTTEFQANIRATLFTTNSNGSTSSAPYIMNSHIGKDDVVDYAKYRLRIKFTESEDVYVEYSFIIDKQTITDIRLNPIDAVYNSNNPTDPSGFRLINDTSIANFNDSTLINQPFTLTYSPKASGAKISTTYYKIPFSYSNLGGSTINALDYSKILTNYEIDSNNISSAIEYSLNYNSIANNIVDPENAFNENKSFIYYFIMTDEAGNQKTKYLIYDLTKPYVLVDTNISTPEIDGIGNIYNIVNSESKLIWGNYKVVKVNDIVTDNAVSNQILNRIIQSEISNGSSLFQLYSSYYMCVPIKNVYVAESYNNITISGSTFVSSVTLYPQVKTTGTAIEKFFSGEKFYDYYITDASHIKSSTSIAKSNITSNFIQMNLDNSMAITYGNYNPENDNTSGEALKNNVATSADQLRFTYIPGDEGASYYVKSVEYSYFELDPSSYTKINDVIEADKSYFDMYDYYTKKGIPYSIYPYKKSPTIGYDTGIITIDTSKKITGDNKRVVSNIINPVSEGNLIKTKAGMYIIKREYDKMEEGSLDKTIRYYYFFVDRNGIIQINSNDSSVPDLNIYETTGQKPMLYEIGSGVLFNFGKLENEDASNPNSPLIHKTYYTAKQIQQYLAFASSNIIFDSNKLPIKLNIPIDKYNTKFVLNRMDSSATYVDDYIAPVSNQNKAQFNLRYVISYSADNNGSSDGNNPIVLDTTNPSDIKINIPYKEVNGYYEIEFKKAGTYFVTIYDNSEARLYKPESIKNQKNNSITFALTISHESPSGNYYSKYNDENKTPMLLNVKESTSSQNETVFKSFNNNSLKFVFDKYDNKYRAEIDPTNIIVKRNNQVIYQKVNQPIDNNILKYVGTALEGKYTLTIFDEDEYAISGNGYLGGTGISRDYLKAKTENITYTITLKYVGNEEDYIIDNDLNFYKKDFTITLDRTKPNFNYNEIVKLDDLKYGASSNINIDKSKYYFPITENFVFKQNEGSGSELDSDVIFVRVLNNKNNYPVDFPEYYRTLTPDDSDYYDEGLTNHIRFSEANAEFEKCSYDPTTGQPSLQANKMFTKGSGYYEVIERDEAQNYKVYIIQYMEKEVSPLEISYNYNPAIPNLDSQGQINAINKTPSILGSELTFTGIGANATGQNDYFYKCAISYNGTTNFVYNNPNDRINPNNWDNFIATINSKLEFANKVSKTGYQITIRFFNRFTDDYVIDYRVPGDRLEPIFKEISAQQFTITIPEDVNGTYIKKFSAYKFVNGVWQMLTQDSLGNTIISEKINDSDPSLKNLKYTFGLGEFKFVLVDVFGRGEDETLYPAYYKGMGVNDINKITYGTNIQYENKTYTAGTVQLKYQTNLYKLTIQIYDASSGTYGEILKESDFALYNISEQSLLDGVRTLNFDNTRKNSAVDFKVQLIVEKTGTITNYQFVINKTLPNIELKNLSGGKVTTSNLENEPTIHTENFIVSWDNNIFKPVVNLKRIYTDSTGKQQTEFINNIANGYVVSLVGTYTASISNNLNYSDPSKNIYFKLVSGEIVVYDVVAINSLSEKILQPSPITSTIVVDGVTKVLYRYYALSSYNNKLGASKYIELRVNKNKGLEYLLLNPDATNTKQYKIFGTSNYGYERYIEIVFTDEVQENDALFTNIFVGTPFIVDGRPTGQLTEIEIKKDNKTTTKEITSVAESITVKWNSYFSGTGDSELYRGNIIYADYYFNDVYAKTISSTGSAQNTFTFKTAGIHKFEFRDLAGNQQTFFGSISLTINLINDVLFMVNNENPVVNKIFNGDVILSVTNRHLYSTDPIVTAKLNNTAIEVDNVGTSFNDYKFSKQGYYEVTIQTRVTTPSDVVNVTTLYSFTILNEKQALPCFNVPQNANFKVVKLLKENADITYQLTTLNELWISPATLGIGNYTVTLSSYNEELGKDMLFTFKVWINNETPYILSSTAFGTGTTGNITLSYNPKIIYDQIGDSYIKIGNETIIPINVNSPNAISTYVLKNNQIYYIQIFSSDDKLITSYKVTKNEPLNTTAIIIIVVASVIVVALIIVFIVIRRHLKFR